MDPLARFLEDYLREVAAVVNRQARAAQGRAALGTVPGRAASEDEEIELDRTCDLLLDRHCERAGLSAEVRSEHGVRRVGGRAPAYTIAIDPFDGSGLFRRGLPAEWWSVLSVFPHGGAEPVAGGAVDVLRQEIYLAGDRGVTLVSLDTSQRRTLEAPERMAALSDRTVLAAYLMDPAYLLDWTTQGARLLQRLVSTHPSARVWPNGGSCIYAWLARGLVHGYVMFGEPRSEIDPGIAFARAAGLILAEARPGGGLVPYAYQPEKTAERVGCFIAAVSEPLARDIAQAIQAP